MTDPRQADDPGRDPALDAAWRAFSVETPPPALDAAILAAAHREANARPRATGADEDDNADDALAEAREPPRWWWGLAAAATIGAIAFGLVQTGLNETEPERMAASDVPAGPASPASPIGASPVIAPPVIAPSASTPPASPPPPATALPVQPSPPRVAPSVADAPPSAPALAPDPGRTKQQQERAREQALTFKPEDSQERGTAPAEKFVAPPPPVPSVAAPPAAPAAAPVPMARERAAAMGDAAGGAAAGSSATQAVARPEDFVARIRAQRLAGRDDEAARELASFRKAFADADTRLPEDLRAWAATVPASR